MAAERCRAEFLGEGQRTFEMKEFKAAQPLQRLLPFAGTSILDDLIKEPSLSAGARVLWIMLAEYHGKSAECFPLETMLAAWLGVKVRQLQSYLRELEDYRRGALIEVQRVWVEKERKTRN